MAQELGIRIRRYWNKRIATQKEWWQRPKHCIGKGCDYIRYIFFQTEEEGASVTVKDVLKKRKPYWMAYEEDY